MYVITEWLQRYEVNSKGQAAREGEKLRRGPLLYIRSKVHGLSVGPGFAAMEREAKKVGISAYEVFGIFHKLLEIGADQASENRGVLRNHRSDPATLHELSFIMRINEDKLEQALQVLMSGKVMWIAKTDQLSTSESSAEFPEIPGKFGKSGVAINEGKSQSGSEVSAGAQVITAPVLNESKDGQVAEDRQVSLKFPAPLNNETNRNENETQRNTTQGKPGAIASGDLPRREHDSAANSLSAKLSAASISLRFVDACQAVLGAKTKSDRTAVANVGRWLQVQTVTGKFDDEIFVRVLDIARDCKGGRNRFALFFSKMDEDIGYRARVVKEKEGRK